MSETTQVFINLFSFGIPYYAKETSLQCCPWTQICIVSRSKLLDKLLSSLEPSHLLQHCFFMMIEHPKLQLLAGSLNCLGSK